MAKKLTKKASMKAKAKEMGKRPNIPEGTKISLEIQRKTRFGSSGVGTGRVTHKVVTVRCPLRQWDYSVEDAQGRIYSLTFAQGEPVRMSGDKADYAVLSSDFDFGGRDANPDALSQEARERIDAGRGPQFIFIEAGVVVDEDSEEWQRRMHAGERFRYMATTSAERADPFASWPPALRPRRPRFRNNPRTRSSLRLYRAHHGAMAPRVVEGSFWTDDREAASRYGGRSPLLAEVRLDLSGLVVVGVPPYDHDTDTGPLDTDRERQVLASTGVDVATYDDEDVTGRPHRTFVLLSKKAVAAATPVAVGVEENPEREDNPRRPLTSATTDLTRSLKF
jgi:hypothetical protein